MIAIEAANGSLGFVERPPGGTVAYVDADWIPRAGGASPALLVSAEGTVAWSGRATGVAVPGRSADAAAGLVLDALAVAAASVARSAPGSHGHVYGEGIVAGWVRDRLGALSDRADGAPGVVVDTTVDSDTLSSATRIVEDLGTVVLAAGANDRAVTLDLYPDVHVRGLRLVAAAPALEHVLHVPDAEAERLAEAVREAAVDVHPGEPLPRAPLYRLA